MFQHYWYQCVGGGVVERRAHLAEKEARESWVGGRVRAVSVAYGSSPFRTSLYKGAVCSPTDLYHYNVKGNTHTNVRGKQCGNCGINTKYLKSSEIMIRRLERIALCCTERTHTHTYTHTCTQRSNLDHWEGFCYLASDLQLAFFRPNSLFFSPPLCWL